MRLDRFLSNLPRFNRQQVRLLLVQRRIRVDGQATADPHHEVREFSRVEVDDEVDPQHRTVLDLLQEPDVDELHIAGRLDFNTTGLMLLTNDGQWSRRLTQPLTKLPKVYYVETEQEIGRASTTPRRSPRACTSPSKTSPPSPPNCNCWGRARPG